jgi:hypothetical protein
MTDQAVEIETCNAPCADGGEDKASDQRAHDAEDNIEEEAFALFVDNFASDESRSKPEYYPFSPGDCRNNRCGRVPVQSRSKPVRSRRNSSMRERIPKNHRQRAVGSSSTSAQPSGICRARGRRARSYSHTTEMTLSRSATQMYSQATIKKMIARCTQPGSRHRAETPGCARATQNARKAYGNQGETSSSTAVEVKMARAIHPCACP